jgi:hypothetical protein
VRCGNVLSRWCLRPIAARGTPPPTRRACQRSSVQWHAGRRGRGRPPRRRQPRPDRPGVQAPTRRRCGAGRRGAVRDTAAPKIAKCWATSGLSIASDAGSPVTAEQGPRVPEGRSGSPGHFPRTRARSRPKPCPPRPRRQYPDDPRQSFTPSWLVRKPRSVAPAGSPRQASRSPRCRVAIGAERRVLPRGYGSGATNRRWPYRSRFRSLLGCSGRRVR